MPAYNANAASLNKPNLNPGQPVEIITMDDVVSAGFKSQQVAFHRNPHKPTCLSVSIEFSADPGAFQIDLCTADEDADKFYVTQASLTDGLNNSFVGRIEVTDIVAKFIRLEVVSLTNAVDISAKVN